ncbi:laminin subunit beta-1-like [Spea bombifrons]|uniref:laminin subunit beta-1-like n=1 Tax=Spea bombifrons TaxID=233779 RepID=UPI00234A5845|nr:laminin subunit beta-1-like [Spea bombifrons]XP_053324822.1 laminin subunit beta-1-like [Spea bombifrons]XP_053324823.1 laminin subunit beta-1-like [Spea bombifrons]
MTLRGSMHALLYVPLIAQVLSALAEEPDVFHHVCSDGGCYPATGNLLIGRDKNLTATSTCGMEGPQEYCIVSHLQDSEKCFLCDSRAPNRKESHRIQNVIYLTGPDAEKTWWQSENGMESVSIRLDLEAEFHFTHLILKFKTFRPAAMLIERSADFGRTWKVYRYFSYNCTKMFPGIPVHALHKIDDVICDQRYSDIEPSSEGEVIFKVLDPSIKVEDPYSLEIQELLQITNLRINFTKLHTLGDNLLDQRAEVLQKYYYSVYELVVRGSCFCYGHASECSPVEGVEAQAEGMIHGRCVCKHHTKGLNCEKCQDFYHDLPWRPAEASNPHSCKQCNCNNHSRKCHFDMAVFLATGRVSGGVCDDCKHNTVGRNCELCKPFYYQNPRADIRAENACIPCDCDPVGSLDGGVCDSHTNVNLGMIAGQCRCKENVRGERCDSCKESFYGLSRNDPAGCQPCRCDPRGIVPGNSPCDHISGDCYCKRFVTGRYCNQCLAEFWGLSNDITGCRPCDCDFGGAYNNRCSFEDGQCDCRSNVIGRQCDDVQPGYFCMPLDYYTYEAENAKGLSPTDPNNPGSPKPEAQTDCVEYYNGIQNGKKVRLRRQRRTIRVLQQRASQRRARQLQQKPDVQIIRREHSPDHMITWTGPGFARVRDGAGLLFHISNIPYPMDYDIMIRYEPETAEDWEAIVSVTSQILPMSSRCGNVLPSEQMYKEKLPHTERYLVLPKPFCFEANNQYEISIRFQRWGVTNRHPGAFILIDSLVLLPRVSELPGFHGNDPVSVHHREEMERYMCLDSFKMATMPVLAEMCIKLICSISAIIHDGALPCLCDMQGSVSAVCDKIGGQCKCKPNVIGQRCDQCAPGTYGFGPYGCSKCDCHSQGSISRFCNPFTGQCECQNNVFGRQCDQCTPGQWGFPNCRPCQCNGHSEECDPKTGTCIGCRDFTSGRHCDKCLDGYYGDPILGSGQQCRPCPCPGFPGSRNYHGSSCYADRESNHIVCLCAPGYAGMRCDRCSSGYFGNPDQEGGECRPCQCNNNIDPTDPESCDSRTGACLKCLYNTQGSNCGECKAGYFGSAVQRNCRRCTCNDLGTLQSSCFGDICHCNKVTGHCPCRANVLGKNCDQCAPNFWNFGGVSGCEPCGCDPTHSIRQDCNKFTGQCHCQPGFGGRVCSSCQQNFWGDPRRKCEACNCDQYGSEISQCDHLTGKCVCREGFAGQRCDQCDRGFKDNFPRCSPCHQCFAQWDLIIAQLRNQLRGIQQKVSNLTELGEAPQISNSQIRELEDRLRSIKELIEDGGIEGTRMVEQMNKLVNRIRTEVAQLSYQLHSQEKRMNETLGKDRKQNRKLDSLILEITQVNETVFLLKTQIEAIAAAGFNESYSSILKSYLDSVAAERTANGSVSGPDSPVFQSQQTRLETEKLLKESLDAYRRSMAAQRSSLKELEKKVQSLSVTKINEKICGTPGDEPCAQAACGGANCRDDEGRLKCGGEGCNGAVPVSTKALKTAQNVSVELENMANQLMDIAQKIQEVQGIAQDVKAQSELTLDKAKDSKRRIEDSTEKLRKFIRRIKDFLMEEGADPESIELVARQVLGISLPASPGDITKLLTQIKDSIGNLSCVDTILNNTSESLAGVRELLNQAISAEKDAEAVNGKVTDAKMLLEDADGKAKAAEKALKKAKQNVKGLKTTVDESISKIKEIEQNEMGIMNRLANLSSNVEKLVAKVDSNRKMATEAKDKATTALSTTGELNKDMDKVKKKYAELKNKVGSIDTSSGSTMDRVQKIKEEAKNLLKKATDAKKKLDGLDEKFKANEEEMKMKMIELRGLENKTTDLLNEIRDQSNVYATC